MIKKIIPLNIENYGFNLDEDDCFSSIHENHNLIDVVRKFFKEVEDENPEYWWNGLRLENFNGTYDRIYALFYKGTLIGYVGITPRSEITELLPYESIPGEYISVALLNKYRGKGIAKKMVAEAISDFESNSGYGKLKNPVWTVHEDNKKSQALFKSLISGNEYLKNLGIRLIIKDKFNNFKDMSKDTNAPTTVEEFLEFAKTAFVPAEKMAGAGAPPPPEAMPPQGGMPPMDPSAMPPPGAMPPDPSMMGGAMPPMDPGMGGAAPQGGDPVAEIIPMLEEFGSTVQKQEQDINAMRQEFADLKQSFIDLQNKYSQIAGQYSTIISIMQGGKLPGAPKLSV